MIDSALGLDPDDNSEEAKAKRRLRGRADFDGIAFVAKIAVEPNNDPRYPDPAMVRRWHADPFGFLRHGTTCLRSLAARHPPRPLDRHRRNYLPDGVASSTARISSCRLIVEAAQTRPRRDLPDETSIAA
jgi:hypothetical protein